MPLSGNVEVVFDRFVREHARAVLAYCLRRADHADAHDAAAATFSTAWRRFETVPSGNASRYWLLAVARRVLSNQRRSRDRRHRLLERAGGLAAGSHATPETVMLRNAEDQEVVDALANLDHIDCEVLLLVVWDEVPRAEVAALLGVSLDAVHKRFQRALVRLERLLGPDTDVAAASTLEEQNR